MALVAAGGSNRRIVGEGLAERAERCVGGVVGLLRAATAGLLSKICLGALARAGRAGMGPIESIRAPPERGEERLTKSVSVSVSVSIL